MNALAERLRARKIAVAYTRGDIATGQALNIKAGVIKGGTVASGGAVKA